MSPGSMSALLSSDSLKHAIMIQTNRKQMTNRTQITNSHKIFLDRKRPGHNVIFRLALETWNEPRDQTRAEHRTLKMKEITLSLFDQRFHFPRTKWHRTVRCFMTNTLRSSVFSVFPKNQHRHNKYTMAD